MIALGFNRHAAQYLSKVAGGGGTFPSTSTPWVVNKFAADFFSVLNRKPIAVYPFIGGTAEAHSQDLIGKYPLTFGGTATHSATGVLTTASTTATNDNLDPITAIPDLNRWIFGIYSRTNISADGIYDMGAGDSGSSMALSVRALAGNTSGFAANITSFLGASGASTGLFSMIRYTNNQAGLYRNGTTVISTASTPTHLPSTNFGIIRATNVGTASTIVRSYGFAFLGGDIGGIGLVDITIINTVYNLIQALQTHLGRQV